MESSRQKSGKERCDSKEYSFTIHILLPFDILYWIPRNHGYSHNYSFLTRPPPPPPPLLPPWVQCKPIPPRVSPSPLSSPSSAFSSSFSSSSSSSPLELWGWPRDRRLGGITLRKPGIRSQIMQTQPHLKHKSAKREANHVFESRSSLIRFHCLI